MSAIRIVALAFMASALGGCGLGLFVPEFQEISSDRVEGQQLVQSIVYNVTCEVQDAVYKIYHNPDHPREHTFLDTWGANIALNLQVEEKLLTNPAMNWLPPSPASAIFNLGASGTLSAGATRQDKLNSYFTIAQIRALGPRSPGRAAYSCCKVIWGWKNGSGSM